MLTGGIPTGPDALTAAWLTDVLRASGTLVRAKVLAFQQEPLPNANGQLVRLTVHYDRDEAAPATLIAKFPSADAAGRALWTRFGFYEREIMFYQHIAKTSGLRTPVCYYSAIDTKSEASVLLLEDLSPARTWLANCSHGEALLVVRQIAQLHARWWGNEQLDTMDWLPGLDSAHYRHLEGELQQSWEPFLAKLSPICPPQLLDIGDALRQRLSIIAARLGEPPQTIIHYDFHLGNILFDAREGTVPFAVVDWEFTRKGRGPHDLARLLGFNLPVERRQAEEQAILREYYLALVEQGITGYPLEQCVDDYRMAMLDCLARAIVMVGAREPHPLRTQKVLQYGTAVLDLHADEFVW